MIYYCLIMMFFVQISRDGWLSVGRAAQNVRQGPRGVLQHAEVWAKAASEGETSAVQGFVFSTLNTPCCILIEKHSTLFILWSAMSCIWVWLPQWQQFVTCSLSHNNYIIFITLISSPEDIMTYTERKYISVPIYGLFDTGGLPYQDQLQQL